MPLPPENLKCFGKLVYCDKETSSKNDNLQGECPICLDAFLDIGDEADQDETLQNFNPLKNYVFQLSWLILVEAH